MRTTVTLEPDVRLLVERTMCDRGQSFEEVVNEAIRSGLGSAEGRGGSYTTPRRLGPARVDVTKALCSAVEHEDEALAARFAEGR